RKSCPKVESPEFHRQEERQYTDNVVRNYKYSPLTLFEQFQCAANLNFLLMVVIYRLPFLSFLFSPLSVCLPPSLHLWSRQEDALTLKLTPSFNTVQLKDLCVGDELWIHEDHVIPADLLLLCSSEPHSLCYVETADIVSRPTLNTGRHSVGAFDGVVLCEEPNKSLYSVRGQLHWRGECLLLDSEHILLRVTVLHNTDFAYGLAKYTGVDTKILRNCRKPKVKMNQMEKVFNQVVIGIVLTVLLAALSGSPHASSSLPFSCVKLLSNCGWVVKRSAHVCRLATVPMTSHVSYLPGKHEGGINHSNVKSVL
uniref:P-type ATPase N-terminal domain-containing protein n=1 Tax=Stegastes partitus TaxID=144197 RepID=A0A3B5BEA1_9TELE